MAAEEEKTSNLKDKIVNFTKTHKRGVGLSVGALALVIIAVVVLFGLNRNPLVGTWKSADGDSEMVFTEKTVSQEYGTIPYRITEDGDHIQVETGSLTQTYSFTVKNDVLTFDGNKYYKEDSSAYKDARAASSSSVAKAQQKQRADEEAAKKKEKKFKSVYEATQKRLTSELAKRLAGKWQYSKTSDYGFNGHKTITKTYTFDESNANVTYSSSDDVKYDKPTDYNQNKTETEEGKAVFKITKLPTKLGSTSSYSDEEDSTSFSLSGVSESELNKEIKALKAVTLDNYFEKMHDVFGGYQNDDKYFQLPLSDKTGDLTDESTLSVKFPSTDSSIVQISTSRYTSFSDSDEYKKVQ